MVGGKVVETLDCGDRVWINARGTGCEHGDECAIYVERTPESRAVSEGDDIWWHGDYAMWTPQGRHFHDRKLKRIGFSGVSRALATATAHKKPRPAVTPNGAVLLGDSNLIQEAR